MTARTKPIRPPPKDWKLPAEGDVWRQLTDAGEEDHAYAMFLAFAQIPPAERSLSEGWRRWSGRNTMNSGYYTNGNNWKWGERAARRDIAKIQAEEKEWLERDMERREQDFLVGEELRKMAKEAMPDVELDSPMSIARYIALASDLQEKAIPKLNLQTPEEVSSLLSMLPVERRDIVIRMLIAAEISNG